MVLPKTVLTALNIKRLLLSLLTIGVVSLLVFGITQAFFSDTETSQNNILAAGKLDLKIDNTSYLNHAISSATTWELKDLTANELFFNFNDLKPGDEGEDTISIHVDDNDAWGCMDMTLTKDDDNNCTEPELIDDSSCNEPDGDLLDGELGGLLNFIFWTDDGNNVLEDNEPIIASGSALTVLDSSIVLADSATNNVGGADGDPLVGGQTYNIGKAWCFGTLDPDPVPAGQGEDPTVDSGVNCNGSNLNNASQSDQLMADISFNAVQSRNNPNFSCEGEPTPTPTPSPTPTPNPGEVFGDEVTNVAGTFGHCCDANNLSSAPAVAEPLVTGAPDSPPDTDFIQISDGSSVTVKFADNKAIDGTGADIRIHIYDALFPATALIEVGQGPNCDTTSYSSVGNHLDTADADIDISPTGLSEVQCVKLTDLGTPDETFPTLGFDLDAIEALNSQAVP